MKPIREEDIYSNFYYIFTDDIANGEIYFSREKQPNLKNPTNYIYFNLNSFNHRFFTRFDSFSALVSSMEKLKTRLFYRFTDDLLDQNNTNIALYITAQKAFGTYLSKQMNIKKMIRTNQVEEVCVHVFSREDILVLFTTERIGLLRLEYKVYAIQESFLKILFNTSRSFSRLELYKSLGSEFKNKIKQYYHFRESENTPELKRLITNLERKEKLKKLKDM